MSDEEIKRLRAKALFLAQALEMRSLKCMELVALLQRHLDWYDGHGPRMHREEETRLIKQTREALLTKGENNES